VLSRAVERAQASVAQLPKTPSSTSIAMTHMAISCDVSNNDSITCAIDSIMKQTSRIDILINGAGITSDSLLMRQSSEYVVITSMIHSFIMHLP
jgi:NAD(P)-dependent dehydrogenase (short-subunit alcohol dehydrogenase family)